MQTLFGPRIHTQATRGPLFGTRKHTNLQKQAYQQRQLCSGECCGHREQSAPLRSPARVTLLVRIPSPLPPSR